MGEKMQEMKQTLVTTQEDGLLDQIAKETERRRPFVVAQKCPVQRNKLQACAAIEEEFKLAGAGAFFSWPVKDHKSGKSTMIEGIGIDGAMIILRNWGNCTYEVELSAENKRYWLFAATFIDLETGASFQRLFRQAKGTALSKSGRYDEERAFDMMFQIGQSKAIRNAVLAGMPEWLKQRAMESAKAGAAAQLGDLQKAINGCIMGFKRLGASQGEMEAFTGKPSHRWTNEDVVSLSAIGRGVKEAGGDVHEALSTSIASEAALEDTTPAVDAVSEPVATATEPEPGAEREPGAEG